MTKIYGYNKFPRFIRGRVIGLLYIYEGVLGFFGYWPHVTMNFMCWFDQKYLRQLK